jgi:hypothetical protein
LGLVVQLQLVVAQGVAQLVVERQLALLFSAMASLKNMVALAPRLAMWVAVSACCISTR